MLTKTKINKSAAIIMLLTMVFSMFQPSTASAQSGDGIKRQVNAESGRVSFIGPESGRALSASRALGTFIRPQDPAIALANRYAPEFGLKDPTRDLSEMRSARSDDGRLTVRFQQNYDGIPVIGGELIVNTNDDGDLYSMNGEVSPNLSLPIQPTIDSAQAADTALQSLAKWYEKSSEDFVASEPELWIFDESLLRPSTRPVELVWRMEVTPVDESMPVRELILVNAQRGNISLHFNQIDTAWAGSSNSTIQLTGDLVPYLAASSWYVATTGNDTNSCASTGSPCATINGAIGKATTGDTVKVATGTYTGSGTEVVLIDKDITLSGGWNASFAAQSGTSTIEGGGARRGIRVESVTVTVERFTIQNGFTNEYNRGGGGIYNNLGTLTVNNSTIANNVSSSDFGGGGGVYNGGTMIVNGSAITGNNINGYGAGGGGIYNYLNGAIITLNNSTVSANNAGTGSGGGIYNSFSTITLNNSTISNNMAGSGAGIYSSGPMTVNSSTISYNKAIGIGGVYNDNSGGLFTFRNTIIVNNTGTVPDCNGYTFSSKGYNIIGNNSGCTFSATTGDLVGTAASPINPRLTPLQDNGGSTLTHALMVGSLAIDAGNPLTPGSGGNACLATDQRGITRPVGAHCDIGAYEGSVPWVPSPFVSTYTANNGTSLPGTLLCNQSQPNCTSGSNPHADGAHKYAIGTYNLYAIEHLRDSINNAGMPIISSVHYKNGYANAFWSGTQMVYGDAYGFPLADDVVAHELTHGVTQHESNLFYYYQSGAINESFSDLWGEYYDQTNGQGNDAAGVKWLLGEDVSGLGVLRSMSNPPAYSDPDKMSSANYYEGDADSGGVHTNSGVNNKAVYLMVNGGTFNGKTVTALDWEKTGAIYYEVNINLLSSGSDYSDLYYALQQACSNLIGQHGITSGNCNEVKDAIDAVQMNGQPAPNFNTDAPLCTAAGTLPNFVFADDLESGTSNWTFTNGGYTRWQQDSPFGPYAQSGAHSLYADDYPPAVTDAKAVLTSISVPANAYLHFAHAYDFEHYAPNIDPNYYDGGVIEYSTNGGSTWLDAGSLIDYNGYDGTIYPNYINPLKGRSAFVGTSHGYISTRLNLASLAGQTVKFRWRMGLDDFVPSWGWWVDDIQVYTCISNRTISGNAGAAGATLSYADGTLKSVTSSANGSYAIQVPPGWSGTVTPSHGCYSFTPTNRKYSNVTADITGQDYNATPTSSSLCVSADSIDFGEQLYYIKSDPVAMTLTNFQSTSVTLGSFQRSSGQFILSSNSCAGATLAPSQSCSFNLQFKPTAYGALSGTLTINSDATNSPNVISLDGVGLSGTQLVTKGGSFEQDNDNDTIPDFWDSSGLTGLDGMSNQYAKHGSYSVKLVGQSGAEKTLRQTITKNGVAGDDFLFVLWSRAQNVPGGFKYRTQISFYNGNSLVERRIKDYTSGTHDWEYRWLPITVSGDYTRIEVEIIYSLPSGTAWFDSNSLKWAP